jgi:hypothetical protein
MKVRSQFQFLAVNLGLDLGLGPVGLANAGSDAVGRDD